uniref:PBP domain-containing protein n=1 Tax=Haptolina brevifila TaxID=156173 RepID=A0A7S2BS48_9EUKA|mmetsp:Transcript_16123/g.32313  ORF Transcript_16123/g.32313 Transcript_16123/m.32313 type:complete len:450 (+) Transcript_16123:132-1481(+)
MSAAKIALLAAVAQTISEVQATGELHGSGTTKASELFWRAMDIIETRTKGPTHLTYRAVGSSTGQKEFVGASNGHAALNHFGAGDIAMSSSRYAALLEAGRMMVHMPFALSAIGVFHSVKASELPTSGSIHLTGCVLAKIFSRQITMWNDPEIVALNPGMTAAAAIKVVHYIHGSSSTTGFTQYLSMKCPAHWPLGSGSTITWPTNTYETQGPDGVPSFITDNTYAIGYIEASAGHEAGLSEVALQNRDGYYLDTRNADFGAMGVVSVSDGRIPSDPTADFSNVNLYDLVGSTTWPITMISYLYIDKDLSAMEAQTAALLQAFVNFIMGAEGQALVVNSLLVPLPAELLLYNTNTLSSLTMPAGYVPYSFEDTSTTMPEVGAGTNVISGKRNDWDELERTRHAATITTLQEQINVLQAQLNALQACTIVCPVDANGRQLEQSFRQPARA